jgi:DNA-binding NarL/FixJ family response regulator
VTSLVVVSGATLVHVGLSAALDGQPDLVLVGSARTGVEARTVVTDLDPDVVLVESHLSDEEPLALATSLRHEVPARGVVLMGAGDSRQTVLALEAGLSAYLPSSTTVEALLATVRHAAVAPGSFTAPDLAQALRTRAQESQALSPREGEVLRHLKDGSTLSTIARTLLVSESTVKTYVSRVYDKLGVHDRRQALAAAARVGLL